MNWYKLAQTYQDILDYPEEYGSQDKELNNAYLYFSIGQNTETQNESFCWLWYRDKLLVKKGRGSHSGAFGYDKVQTSYRGWYDPIQKLLSVVIPRRLGNFDPVSVSNIPIKLKVALMDKFGNDYKIKVF